MDLIFGKYEIQHRLAIGGMGEVFYAVQKGGVFERPVILKSLLPELAAQDGFIDQFLDEARVAATLNHPNVVSIYEVGMWNGTYFIAMEYIRGRNLAQLIRKAMEMQTRIPPLVAARIIREAALGLDHAHHAKDNNGQQLSIVHRDISPQNIMVRDDGVTKVVDFGIARASNRATRTATGALKGKLAYMAPEQILGKELDLRTDEFALGVVFWEMLTGRRLFKADSDILVAKKVLEETLPVPSALESEVPKELDPVVMRMLDRNMSKRFASCAEAAGAIEQVTAALTPPTGESPVLSFMRSLGTEDLVVKVRNAPGSASQNFVLSLKQPGAEIAEEIEIKTATPVSNTGNRRMPPVPGSIDGTGLLENPKKNKSRNGLVALLLLFITCGVGLGITHPWDTPQTIEGRLEIIGLKSIEVKPPLPPEPVVVPVELPKPGKLKITSEPPGAIVRAGGERLGPTPQEIEVSDTSRDQYLMFELAGYKRLEEQVKVKPGETLEFNAKLVKLPPGVVVKPPDPVIPPPPVNDAPGYLSINTDPWAKVTVDGEPWGSTPIFKRKLQSGKHTILFENEAAGVKVTRAVTIKPGETEKILSFK